MEEGLIIMFVNVIINCTDVPLPEAPALPTPRIPPGCDKTVSELGRNGKFPAKILFRRSVNNKFTILLCS